MLCKDPFIIAPATFLLIQQLQANNFLANFVLVGGTNLALQIGHRNSIDIDLFTQNEFNENELFNDLKTLFPITEVYRRKHTIVSIINNIKTDFITHNYPYILPPITEDGITYSSKEDIVAMKLHAIVQSRQRLKDFIDIYFLLEHFSLNNMLEFYTIKYGQSNPMIAVKALNYFEDIDELIDPPKLHKPLPINAIKQRIQAATTNYNKSF